MRNFKQKRRDIPLKTLKPRKHKQIELFIADTFNIANFRDDIASMEHPFFALKSGDTRIREYKNDNESVTVRPSAGLGMATIFDKDIWIYAISKLQQAIFEEKEISPTIQFSVYDFLRTTNRSLGGGYEGFVKALARLSGTRIETNISFSRDESEDAGFGLIDSWKTIKTKKGSQEVTVVAITLPNWLYEQVLKNLVLRISPDYFRIRKAIDRRIYEIARKHCGAQAEFKISLEKLYKKTGATSTKEKFRFNIKQLAKTNDLPDYEVSYNAAADMVSLKNRDDEAIKKYEETMRNIAQKKNREAIVNKQQKLTPSLSCNVDDQQPELDDLERKEAIAKAKTQLSILKSESHTSLNRWKA